MTFNNISTLIKVIKKPIRTGIKESIRIGCEYLIKQDCDLIINLDGDAEVRNDFIPELVKLHQANPTKFVTGFDCTNMNGNSYRHQRFNETATQCERLSAGGINLAFTPEMYTHYIEPILNTNDNWDYLATKQTGVICAKPSLIQHLGINSSMGHDGADISDTFKPLSLPSVTLIGVDNGSHIS